MPRLRIAALTAFVAVVLTASAGAFGVFLEPLPLGVTGQLYDYQFRARGGNPPYTFTVKAGVLPPGLSLSSSGRLTGTPRSSGSWRFFIEGSYRYESNPPRYSQREFFIDVEPGLTIRNRRVPVATSGVAYAARLAASGGGAQSWSIVSGRLPPGLALASSGTLTGTPRRAGTYAFTAAVIDRERVAERTLFLRVVESPRLTVPALPPAVVGAAFTATLRLTGGQAPYSWSVQNGDAPRGLKLQGGRLFGVPQVGGRYGFDIVAADAAGNTATTRLVVVVAARLGIGLQELAVGEVGVPYRSRLLVRGGALPLAFRTFGDLPPGLSLGGASGVIAGTPRRQGRYAFVIVVRDRAGSVHRRQFVIRVR